MDKTYEDGVLEGRLRELEHIATIHDAKHENHEKRIRNLEEWKWAFAGILSFMAFLPVLERLLGK